MSLTTTCGCYYQVQVKQHLSDFQKGVLFAKTGEYKESFDVIEGRCFGTREMERCECGGDRSKCDFYPTAVEKNLEASDDYRSISRSR